MKQIFQAVTVMLFLTGSITVNAQNPDEQLAAQYFSAGEFDKAKILYEKLLKKNPESVYYYQNYFQCLTETKDFDEAEKFLKKQLKRSNGNYQYSVDQGYLMELQGNAKGASEHFTAMINSIPADEEKVSQMANALLKRNMPKRVVETYLAARKKMGSDIFFSDELMTIYLTEGVNNKLVDEGLNLLTKDAEQLPLVKTYLTRMLDRGQAADYLREQCLLFMGKYPGKPVFEELLVWFFIRQKDFKAAYRQTTAIDRREKGEGLRLIELASVCLNNGFFDVAIDCYNYVLQKGTQGYFYIQARMGLLDARYTKASKSVLSDSAELNLLENEFIQFLNDHGRTFSTAPAMKQLADVYVYFIHDLNKGILILEEISTMSRLQPKLEAECKLALGDAYLMRGDVWDAQLIYGQVDTDFKEDPMGQEAKFRNAKVSYFTGDFDWAKDQLDVLKTATSQLISNNAIELSLLIMDNTGLDSTTDALKAFADAELLYFQNKLDESFNILNMMPFRFPNHSLEDDIFLLKARSYVKMKNLAEAEKNYLIVINQFGGDILADNAIMELAVLYEHQLNEKAKALELYEKLIFEYTGSLFVVDARKNINRMKADGVIGDKP